MAHASFGRLDFSRITGRLNPAQHGSNTPAPYAHRWFFNVDEELKSLHFSYSRTHDWALINPGQRIIDTHFIFPLMHLDPKDPKNYYFRATDAAIRITQDLGTKIFYRLGTSIEQNSDQAPEHNNTLVPEDFDQYAEVLAGIVRHYTRGWADGFRYDMKYWEIWNEPELGTQTWCGTKEEFVRFFVTIFKRLKSEFPELKIGGPAFTTPTGEWQTAFLDGCKAAGIVPDFYSYHCYTSDPEKLIQRPDVGRALLDSYGFTKTEIVINEWHFRQDWTGVIPDSQPDLVRFSLNGPMGHNNIQSAVFNLAVLMGWQEKPLDIGCYYGCGIDGAFAFRDRDHRWNKCFYSMQMFGESCKTTVFLPRRPCKHRGAIEHHLLDNQHQYCGYQKDIVRKGPVVGQILLVVYRLLDLHAPDLVEHHELTAHQQVLVVEETAHIGIYRQFCGSAGREDITEIGGKIYYSVDRPVLHQPYRLVHSRAFV